VMSEVIVSISRSSCDRSEKPGRTCFACSLSREATGQRASQWVSASSTWNAHFSFRFPQGFPGPGPSSLPCPRVSCLSADVQSICPPCWRQVDVERNVARGPN
jgi:hypothetical protein